MPKILITGCSSGFGLAIAQTFLSEGWDVVATMRTPRNDLLPANDRLKVLALDVTSAQSIAKAVDAAGSKAPAGADAKIWSREAGHSVG